jgi:hypothetical protein
MHTRKRDTCCERVREHMRLGEQQREHPHCLSLGDARVRTACSSLGAQNSMHTLLDLSRSRTPLNKCCSCLSTSLLKADTIKLVEPGEINRDVQLVAQICWSQMKFSCCAQRRQARCVFFRFRFFS